MPRARKNTLLYSGVLAGNAGGREKIVPKPKRTAIRRRDSSWAALMKHSFGIDPLSCRRCKARMALVAVIHDSKEVRRLLHNLRMFSDPLPPRPRTSRRPRQFRLPMTAARMRDAARETCAREPRAARPRR